MFTIIFFMNVVYVFISNVSLPTLDNFSTGEVCTHITGLLFLLSEYIARGDSLPEETSCTDQKCWWIEQRCTFKYLCLLLLFKFRKIIFYHNKEMHLQIYYYYLFILCIFLAAKMVPVLAEVPLSESNKLKPTAETGSYNCQTID